MSLIMLAENPSIHPLFTFTLLNYPFKSSLIFEHSRYNNEHIN